MGFLLLAAIAVSVVEATSLNIHIKLEGELHEYVENNLSKAIPRLCPHTDIDFVTKEPHVTLYLTNFLRRNVKELISTLDELIPKLSNQCSFRMSLRIISGQYFMWNVEIAQCLQALSDAIVNATYMLHDPDTPIPDWVYQLPEPARSEMIALCQKYGSPGVLNHYNPHVTLAWDDVDDMTPLLGLDYPPIETRALRIGLGLVGPHGTVIRGKDLASWVIGH